MSLALPHIIDVEASGFGAQSYPIEIGVILSSGERYSALIKPARDWTHWCEDAESVHGVSRELLKDRGRPLIEVAGELNQLLDDQVIYSDGWVVDQPWINRLFTAAAIDRRFRVSPLELLLKEPQMQRWQQIRNGVLDELSLPRHRASTDALVIQETFRRSLAFIP